MKYKSIFNSSLEEAVQALKYTLYHWANALPNK